VAATQKDNDLAAEVPSGDQIGLQMIGETTGDQMTEETIDGQTIIVGMIVIDLQTASGSTVIVVTIIGGTEKRIHFYLWHMRASLSKVIMPHGLWRMMLFRGQDISYFFAGETHAGETP
jgi:hypothetical protein